VKSEKYPGRMEISSFSDDFIKNSVRNTAIVTVIQATVVGGIKNQIKR
jgi:hypothetical protein